MNHRCFRLLPPLCRQALTLAVLAGFGAGAAVDGPVVGVAGSVAALQDALGIETPALEFRISPRQGEFEIRDKASGVVWHSNRERPRFGQLWLTASDQTRRIDLQQCELRAIPTGIVAAFQPLPDQPDARLRVRITRTADPRALEFAYEADAALKVDSIRLFDDGLAVTDAEQGSVVVPVREGLLISADSRRAFEHRFDTYAYEGCHMAMFGVVKRGATALITWEDPYAALDLKSELTSGSAAAPKQILIPSLVLRKSARSFRIQFNGAGDYVSLAKSYRELAQIRGWLVGWEEKLKAHPRAEKLIGAINFKLWSALSRQMTDDSQQEKSKRLNWTFDEAAQIAAHLRNDLQLEHVLFTVGGWIHRGYDNQHPDILPAAPECGGDEGLRSCAQRVEALGYLFCLHDNYQDIYRDSPSWDEKYIMKNPKGDLVVGGNWAGGKAYLTCSEMALELARRPQNLAAVQKLTGASAYFIDTTYAAGLQECFDPKHPLTRLDDMKWKRFLSDYARNLFGVFGSECGREWAIPHSDFFEGLTGVSGRAYHDEGLLTKVGGTVVPLFELVYRDTIAMYGKYGYDINRAAEYVLQHILIGRPLNYHSVPSHLYWRNVPSRPDRAKTSSETTPAPALTAGDAALFTRAEGGWAEGLHPLDRFVKNTYEILSPLNALTARLPMTAHQFLTGDRKIQRTVFGERAGAVEVVVNASPLNYTLVSKQAGTVTLPPFGFLVEAPGFAAFHARSWNGLTYDQPVFFTLRAQDGQPIATSKAVRIYHGFGDPRVQLGNRLVTVAKEQVVN